jgi:tetratricopeptide (TPR) repeat protein
MKRQIVSYLDNAITLILLIVAGLTPLLFVNQMTEFYEMPKLVLLIVATVILYLLWIFSWIVKGKIVLTRTPLDIPLLLLLVVILLSTYFSVSRYSAIFGNFPTVHGSAVSWVTYILLYFVTVANLRNLAQIKNFIYVLYAGGLLVAIVSILSFFGLFLPFDFARAVNFTPTGSSFSTVALLLMLLPLPFLSLVNPNKYMPVPVAIGLSILFGVTIILIGSVGELVALLIAIGICLFVSKPAQVKQSGAYVTGPIAVLALVFIFAYLPFRGNALNTLETNFPKEIQLPFTMSWKVSVTAFRDAPFIGSGPSTYLFNFTQYKPLEFNALKYWNFSFNTAYDEYLQVLGTLGFFGILALLLLTLAIINNSRKNLFFDPADTRSDNTHILVPSLAVSGLLTIVVLAIHATTLVSTAVTFFILAALMMSQRSIREKVTELSMGIKASTVDNKQIDLFPVIIFILFLAGGIYVLFSTITDVRADYYHRLALNEVNLSGTQTYADLQMAETLNPYVDLYRIDMAQTNFALANALVLQKGPTRANPKGSLTDQDKTTITTLLSQSVNEGRVAVALSPENSQNWSVLAAVYRNIAGVAANALSYSLAAYNQAIALDPMNPLLRMNVGGIYYSVRNYSLATRFFTDAANLKPDYANAYFNLAIAYQQNNDMQDAYVVANQTVNIIGQTSPNSPDYKTATELLSAIKQAILKNQPAQVTQTAPASQTNSAIQSKNVGSVKVKNLNNPPSVTPAPTVQPNPNAAVPQANPTGGAKPSTTP